MPYTDEKLGGAFGVDKNFVPVGFHWNVLRRFTDDEGKAIGEMRTQVPFTLEELHAHITPALTARDQDIEADRKEADALKAEIAAERQKVIDEKQKADEAVKLAQDALKAAEAAFAKRVAEHEAAMAQKNSALKQAQAAIAMLVPE